MGDEVGESQEIRLAKNKERLRRKTFALCSLPRIICYRHFLIIVLVWVNTELLFVVASDFSDLEYRVLALFLHCSCQFIFNDTRS